MNHIDAIVGVYVNVHITPGHITLFTLLGRAKLPTLQRVFSVIDGQIACSSKAPIACCAPFMKDMLQDQLL